MDLRDDALKKHVWQNIDLGEMLAGTLRLFEKLLFHESTKKCHLLHKQIVKCVVLLSDLFSYGQFEWMIDLFLKFYDADQIDDFLLKQYLVLGICKVQTSSIFKLLTIFLSQLRLFNKGPNLHPFL